jgi:hypothetical protein
VQPLHYATLSGQKVYRALCAGRDVERLDP